MEVTTWIKHRQRGDRRLNRLSSVNWYYRMADEGRFILRKPVIQKSVGT